MSSTTDEEVALVGDFDRRLKEYLYNDEGTLQYLRLKKIADALYGDDDEFAVERIGDMVAGKFYPRKEQCEAIEEVAGIELLIPESKIEIGD